MSSPLLLDQLATQHRLDLLAEVSRHRSTRRPAAARTGDASRRPTLAGMRALLARLTPAGNQAQLCCA